jgi:hypothetical protein
MATPPYTVVNANAVGADAVATFPAAVVARRLIGLTVNGPRGATIAIYMGFVAPSSRIDQNVNGYSNNQDYASPRTIPAGLNVLAVWPGQAARATQCQCTFHVEDM